MYRRSPPGEARQSAFQPLSRHLIRTAVHLAISCVNYFELSLALLCHYTTSSPYPQLSYGGPFRPFLRCTFPADLQKFYEPGYAANAYATRHMP
jgi:hypothetical protein